MLPALHQCLWTQKAILEVAASTYSGYPYSVPSVCCSHYVQGNSDGPTLKEPYDVREGRSVLVAVMK